jgi:predicted transcriptional regulator
MRSFTLASPNAIMLSIHFQHAAKILAGTKTVELRRVRPRFIGKGDVAFIYVPSPIKSLIGAFKIDHVVEMPVRKLWWVVQEKAGIPRKEFNAYYEGASKGVGIFFAKVWNLPKPLGLQELRENHGIRPPQSFCYVTEREFLGAGDVARSEGAEFHNMYFWSSFSPLPLSRDDRETRSACPACLEFDPGASYPRFNTNKQDRGRR